jgi:hypothetical protein
MPRPVIKSESQKRGNPAKRGDEVNVPDIRGNTDWEYGPEEPDREISHVGESGH